MNVEQIQMLVAPAEGDLQRVMQIGDRAVAARQQTAPNHRTDLVNPDVEPENLDIGRVFQGVLALPIPIRITARCRQTLVCSAPPILAKISPFPSREGRTTTIFGFRFWC